MLNYSNRSGCSHPERRLCSWKAKYNSRSKTFAQHVAHKTVTQNVSLTTFRAKRFEFRTGSPKRLGRPGRPGEAPTPTGFRV